MKSKGVFLAAILAAVLCSSGNVFAVLSGGGTQENPYLIQSRTDFDTFANPANAATYWASGVYTKLICNLDMADTIYTQAVIAPDMDTEDGTEEFVGTQFTGIFDGNGHVVSGLLVIESEKDYIGLFGAVGTGGEVKNLGIENAGISGRSYVGGLAGQTYGSLTNCYVMGWVVSGGYNAGGLTGWSGTGTLTDCYATCSVGVDDTAGGLVGWNDSSTLINCYATGSVNSNDTAGGLVGWGNSGSLTGCHATGTVAGQSYVGGLMGYNDNGVGQLNSCYATGSVNGADHVGGLVGQNWGPAVSSCYATGSVYGTYYDIGGLIGFDYGPVTNCYATGSVSGTGDIVGGLLGDAQNGLVSDCYAAGSVSGTSRVGGLVGYLSTDIANCFWDINTSETSDGVGNVNPDPAGVAGKTTAQMKTLSTFTSAGWDFSATDGDPADWVMLANSYPRLAWQTSYPGDIAGSYGVNFVDYVYFATHWLMTGCSSSNNFCGGADLNASGTVDMFDLDILADNWLKGF